MPLPRDVVRACFPPSMWAELEASPEGMTDDLVMLARAATASLREAIDLMDRMTTEEIDEALR